MEKLKTFCFFLCFTSAACSFSIDCSSIITRSGSSYCIGVPISCTVTLDEALCPSENVSVVDTLQVQVTKVNINVNPSFSSSQVQNILTIITDYVPMIDQSRITVEVSAESMNCSFSLTHTNDTKSSLENCNYPLAFGVISYMPVNMTYYNGGDFVNLVLEINASLPLTMVTFVLDDIHPALLLIGDSISDHTTVHANLTNIHPIGNHSTLLAGGITVEPENILVANITFRVQPYVLPQAHLFFSFKTYYLSETFADFSLVQVLHFFDEFQSSPVNSINITFSLPYYAYEDHVEDTFPPQVGDIFEIEIQIEVPCVSTNLNFTLGLPEFWSDVYTMFFTNATNINISIPYNMVYISELCNYEDRLSFDSSSCDIENLVSVFDSPNITKGERAAFGVDKLHIYFGAVTYNLTDCNLTSQSSNCECIEQEINVTLTGEVVSDMICLNQTLTDNITIDYEYSSESVIEDILLDIDLNHTIIFDDVLEEVIYPINASMPAISVPINSYAGDAGDSYNLTFGVLHNGEYSSFTAYDLNYTFSVNPHLDPEDHITICYYNSSDIAFSCEEHPFIDYRISRNGFHPV